MNQALQSFHLLKGGCMQLTGFCSISTTSPDGGLAGHMAELARFMYLTSSSLDSLKVISLEQVLSLGIILKG